VTAVEKRMLKCPQFIFVKLRFVVLWACLTQASCSQEVKHLNYIKTSKA